MNRVSVSGVAETVGDKILATVEKGYKYMREAEKEPLALDWNWRHQGELVVFNIYINRDVHT